LQIDRQRVEECLTAHSTDPAICFFSASEACEAEEIAKAPSQLRARMWCDYRERDVWLEIQKGTLAEMLAALPQEEGARLRHSSGTGRKAAARLVRSPIRSCKEAGSVPKRRAVTSSTSRRGPRNS
jgi:hypothetical protein